VSRIGILSPYPGFADLARKVASEQSLEVEIHHAVLDEAVSIARRWEREHTVQAVVARGLTATMLRQQLTRLPVVAIEVTGYDVIRALSAARQKGSRIAYIDYAHPVQPYDLDEIRAILGLDFTPMLYSTRIGILRQLVRARREGYDVVVSTGTIATDAASSHDLQAIMVESSPMAIRDALLQARAELEHHRKAEYRDKRGQAVLEHIRDGIIVVNYRGRVTIYNPAAERILGLPAAEVLHKPAQAITHPGFVAIYGGGAEASGDMQVLDGRQFVISRVPIQVAGEPAGLVITFQTVSAIMRLEEKIRRELHAKGLTARYSFSDIIGRSSAIREAVAKARKYARSELTVLVTGESGTGKELFAHAIHHYSPRQQGPFVAVNCAALPESLLESELFGYEEGAFTGARKGGKPGLFELAHQGTIFLDEIGELSVSLQARLLRVLQNQEVLRLGGDRLIPVSVRVVAATNRDLAAAVREGRFREDLYYRLNVLNLSVPPLRERLEDIPLLASHFLSNRGEVGVDLPPSCLQALTRHHWPGNVRELRNFLLKFMILADGEEQAEPLFMRLLDEVQGLHRTGPAPAVAAGQDPESVVVRIGTMEEMERQILQQLNQRYGSDRAGLARLLGISRTTVWKKLKEGAEEVRH